VVDGGEGYTALYPFTESEEWELARKAASYHTIVWANAKYIIASEYEISRDEAIRIAAKHYNGECTHVKFDE